MPIVQFEGLPKKRFAVGMEWRGLQGAGAAARREASAIAKETQVPFGCIIEDEESGIAVLGLTSETAFGVISGAAWLANSGTKEGVILVEKTTEGMYWVCSVRGQMPMADGDLLVPFEEVSARVSAAKMRSPDARICSTIEGIEDILGAVVGQSFAELVSSSGASPVRIRRLLGGERRALVIAVAGAVIFGGYWLADDYYKKAKAKKNLAILNATSAQRKADQERQVTQLKAQRLAEATRQIGEVVLNRPSVSDSVQATVNVVRALPLSRGGWAPVKVDCGSTFCTISWKREPYATSVDFLHSAQADGIQVTDLKGDVASTFVEVQVQPRQSRLDDLSPVGPFVVALQSNMQRLAMAGLATSLKGPDSIDKLIPKPVPPKGIQPITFDPLPWSVGEVVIRGKTFFEMSSVPDYVQHQGVALKNAAINLESGQWEMTFSFAAK
ncbi:MAG: type 4b pilus protein PilO2 [Polaromonas sp.]|nr:type 4b pilus protein PilO2 [Polaromonas sp.]